jgi:hypothetical protein
LLVTEPFFYVAGMAAVFAALIAVAGKWFPAARALQLINSLLCHFIRVVFPPGRAARIRAEFTRLHARALL